jgi:hypothetical protein
MMFFQYKSAILCLIFLYSYSCSCSYYWACMYVCVHYLGTPNKKKLNYDWIEFIYKHTYLCIYSIFIKHKLNEHCSTNNLKFSQQKIFPRVKKKIYYMKEQKKKREKNTEI